MMALSESESQDPEVSPGRQHTAPVMTSRAQEGPEEQLIIRCETTQKGHWLGKMEVTKGVSGRPQTQAEEVSS